MGPTRVVQFYPMVGMIRPFKKILSTFLSTLQKVRSFIISMDVSEVIKDANLLYKVLDDIVEEVGEENGVQVVTDNASNYVKVVKNKKVLRSHSLSIFLTS